MKKKSFSVDKRVFLLGVVSFLTDISSEAIFSVFSVFFTVVLGASTAILGLIEGLSDFSSSSLDYISGYLSDKTGRRKRFAVLGYAFSTLAKIILVFTNTVFFAGVFRVIERLGKSFRGPPRDAWISSYTTKENRGYSFAVHKTLDKMGAILGPVIAYFILRNYGENIFTFKMLFIVALVPAVLSVLLLLFLKDKTVKPKQKENIFKTFKNLDYKFKKYLFAASIFSLSYFSFSFLLLKAYSSGFNVADTVLLYALFNLSFVVFAAPMGRIGDRFGRKNIISLEYLVYAVMCLGFIFVSTKTGIIVLFILFGIFYAIDESQSKAYISDLEKERRATAIGLYNFTTGVIYFPASVIAGALWVANPNYAFLFSGLTSICALIYFKIKN